MAELPDNLVKRGFWVDWSNGPVLGATITVDTKTSNVLVALLAILVSFAGSHLWNLLVFGYHQCRTKKAQSDGLFRQQQASLRTLPPPETLIIDFVRLSWVWKTKAQQSFIRCLFPCSIALLFFLLTISTGVFSSLVVATSNVHVLVNSRECSIPNLFSSSSWVKTRHSEAVSESQLVLSQVYSQNCYTSSANSPVCRTYVQPSIPFSTVATHCPFASNMCNGTGDNVAIAFDTGLLDSNEIFGINAKPEERIKIRFRTTCAAMVAADRYSVENLTEMVDENYPLPGEQYYALHYGNYPGQNATFFHSSYVANLTKKYSTTVLSRRPRLGWEASSFAPIPELQRPDADVILGMVFSNSVINSNQTDDPVFSAHRSTPVDPYYHNRKIGFLSDYPAGVIGCAEQYEFCTVNQKSSLDECSLLSGKLNSEDIREYFPKANEKQVATIKLFTRPTVSMSDIAFLALPQLKAYSSVLPDGWQPTLIPNTHWMSEAGFWFEFFLSEWQVVISSLAQGIWLNHEQKSLATQPMTVGERELCQSQKMRKQGGFANVSVFGLAFIIAVSSTLILADAVLLKFVIYHNRVRTIMAQRIDNWVRDGVLQLQRRAYQIGGKGDWVRLDKEIPLNEGSQALAQLRLDSYDADLSLGSVKVYYERPEKSDSDSDSRNSR